MGRSMSHRVIIREDLHRRLVDHLLRRIRNTYPEEEVCFALWYPGDGVLRYTGLLSELILPTATDRDLHGNVTVHLNYLSRVLERALALNAGVAVLHSHPACGWQNLSHDDRDTERNLILPFVRETQLPLLGLTLAEDEFWSARYWHEVRPGNTHLAHCDDVRRVGPRMSCSDLHPGSVRPYQRRPLLKRTLDSWGIEAQARLARTHVCVVGAGSVGGMVLESLARVGVEQVTIIDHDFIEAHNLDRLIYATPADVGLRKATIASARYRQVTTASRPIVHTVPLSIRSERAYCKAADADLILCCVDNAEARDVLNHLAYSNCLPLIDGGVLVDSTNAGLHSAKWRLNLVGPGMTCLRCRDQYTSSDASDERQGLTRFGQYITDHEPSEPAPGQNTFVFCNLVAAEEARLLVRYLVGKSWWHDDRPTSGYWSFEHRFVDAVTEQFDHPGTCVSSCEFTHHRLGKGRLGRPSYPFLPVVRDHWKTRVGQHYLGLRRKLTQLYSALRS